MKYLHSKKVSLLIGSDISEAHWILDKRIWIRNQSNAYETVFGWVVLGRAGNSKAIKYVINCVKIGTAIEEGLLSLFETKSKDGYNDSKNELSLEDKKVSSLAEDSICMEDNHYILPIHIASSIASNEVYAIVIEQAKQIIMSDEGSATNGGLTGMKRPAQDDSSFTTSEKRPMMIHKPKVSTEMDTQNNTSRVITTGKIIPDRYVGLVIGKKVNR